MPVAVNGTWCFRIVFCSPAWARHHWSSRAAVSVGWAAEFSGCLRSPPRRRRLRGGSSPTRSDSKTRWIPWKNGQTLLATWPSYRAEDELNAFNERIAELEDEGHQSHAMDVLKANAFDFARRIDELRCLLVEPLTRVGLRNHFRR